jgi:hypothetical protein
MKRIAFSIRSTGTMELSSGSVTVFLHKVRSQLRAVLNSKLAGDG